MIIDDALQKWYSALKHLSDYDEKASFIDNISDLDCFFSEYRNVTFVLQKTMADLGKLEIYKTYRDKYFENEKWIIESRNTETKEHPTELQIHANIRVFYPSADIFVRRINVVIDNNHSFESLKDEFTKIIKEYQNDVIYFSVDYKHIINNQDFDLFKYLGNALYNMKSFLDTIIKELKDENKSEMYNKSDLLFKNVYYGKMNTAKDYIYYKKTNTFDASSSITMKAGPDNDQYIIRKKELSLIKHFAPDKDDFYNFTLIHIFPQKVDIVPAYCVIFDDGCFDMLVTSSDIKTTFYRIIDDLSNRIENENINEIYAAVPMTCTDYITGNIIDMLIFSCVNKSGERFEYVFSESDLNDMKKIAKILNSRHNCLLFSSKMMEPIIKTFELKNK